MPTSYFFFKNEIKQWFLENINLSKRILDVGPGCGTYSDLLRSMGYKMDAVEIWEPYIKAYNLQDKYDSVFIDDITRFNISDYDFIILGDILEHLAYQEASTLIQSIKSLNKRCLVAVPYLMEQGEYNGNTYETHHQSDLTPEVMKQRYPDLKLLFSNQYYGYYMMNVKTEKAYVLYATESYADTVQGCVDSLRAFSKFPIYVYMLNSDTQIEGATCIHWICDIPELGTKNKFIDRHDKGIYKMLIQRPLIVRNCLAIYAETVAYVDADSVATQYIDNIFNYYPDNCTIPYFVEGTYDYLHIDGRGGADTREDMSKTLEAPACWLFGVDQYVRQRYRQTGFFVAGQNTYKFLGKWYWMCSRPEVMADHETLAPYHEETIANVLLWAWHEFEGLPYIYTNASLDELDNIYNKYEFGKEIRTWFRLPESSQELLFIHGEKNQQIMNKMTEYLINQKKLGTEQALTKVIENYPNYMISINGDVVNIKTGKKLAQRNNQGRLMVELWKNNIKKHYFVYRLLAQAFLPNPENKPQINHIDGIPNVDLNNMEWVTDRENKLHAYRTGLMKQEKFSVNQYSLDGRFITKHESMLAASKSTKIDRKSISLNVSGKYKQAGGYIWKKEEKGKHLKIMYLAPHLSTGGMPQFLLKRIEALKEFTNFETIVVEYQNYSSDYVVQKNKIKAIVNKFYTLGENKLDLFRIIIDNKPDIIHIDEMSERLDSEMVKKLYDPNRTYKLIETCHDISFDPKDKIYHPDAYAFCTPYHLKTFSNLPSYKESIEYPIDADIPWNWVKRSYKDVLGFNQNQTHILNVGLWTPGKNQAEGVLIAKQHPDIEFHFVGNQAPNFKDYWEPLMRDLSPNVHIWGEREDVDTFMKAADIFMFNSTWECNPIVLREAISYGLPIVARNLDQYEDMFTPYIHPIALADLRTMKRGYEIPTDNTSEIFAEKYKEFYLKVNSMKPPIISQNKIKVVQHFVDQPFLEILGESKSNFTVRFYDEKDSLYYENTIKSNHWVRLNRRYFTKWRVVVLKDRKPFYENTLSLKDKRVFISFESESLGDTIAWMPYVLEFQKKHDCHVIVSTFKNFLFKDVYPELEFVEPGSTVLNLYAMYRIGWFYDKDKEPELPNTIPLQKTATNILGLAFQEIKPRVYFDPKKNPTESGYTHTASKYITIATNSTSGCKFWVKGEWQKLVNHLYDKGYKIINVSKEKNTLDHVYTISDTSLENTMNVIYHSEFFIGLSSGLTWLAWAMGTPTVMISNFTEDDHEFTTNCIRITNKDVCHGCWNKAEFKFDKGGWDWCPVHKGTPRQFECHTSITAEMVIAKIHTLIASNLSTEPIDQKDFDWGPMSKENKQTIIKERADNCYQKVFQVEENDIVLDIGASVGTFTCDILGKHPKHVYCVEPSEDEFPTLVKNTIGYPVTPIMKGIASVDGLSANKYLFGEQDWMQAITFSTLCKLYNLKEIDFLKTDCEGGEYDIFNAKNMEFLFDHVKKIVGEFHLRTPELKEKFREFRDHFLTYFVGNREVFVFSIDGQDITWDLWNDHFIEYYGEVIIHMDNRLK